MSVNFRKFKGSSRAAVMVDDGYAGPFKWVHDSRNGNVTGPFTPNEAEKLCSQLCEFTLPPALKGLGGKVVGPFYVRDTSSRIY
jgi:hypothetical protein